MENDWVVFIIKFKQKERLLLDFVKPTIENIEAKGLLKTFHFFFEDDGFHIRIRAFRAEQTKEISEILTNNLKIFPELVYSPSTYIGEEDGYGTEGWKHVQKYFEYCCRISLLKKDTERKLTADPTAIMEILTACKILTSSQPDGKFFEGKFIHCLLNQMTYSVPQEAEYHLKQLFRDRIEVLRQVAPDFLRQTKSQWVRMLQSLQAWINSLP